MKEVVVGADLGGTNTKLGLVTRKGNVLAKHSISTDFTIPYTTFFRNLNNKSRLRQIESEYIEAETITEAALEKDILALEAFSYTGNILGVKLANIVAFLNPEAIIISGGLAKAGDLILEPTRKSLQKNMLGIYRNNIQILSSTLIEENAAILGASAYLWIYD